MKTALLLIAVVILAVYMYSAVKGRRDASLSKDIKYGPFFLDFVFGQMCWSKANIIEDNTGEYTRHSLTIGAGDVKLDVVFKEDEQKLTFSKYLYTDKTPAYDGTNSLAFAKPPVVSRFYHPQILSLER